ncbi:MAG: AfsR/SARP family transcriptional regulator [Caldilineaceae bacterium]
MVRIFCLGTPRIALSHESAALALTPKATALFVYLVVTAAKGKPPPSRDHLADLLWSETNNQQARTNLRYLLPEVRRQLGDYLIITPQTIAWQRQAPYWLDVEQLRTTLTARPETITTLALQANLDLYQGEFLAGFMVRNVPVFEEWVVRQREEIHALVVQGGYTLAERYWQQANYQAGLTATQRLLQWEPWHEAGHRLQMQLLAATGQRAAALAHYARCRTVLADELGVEPEAATVALYEQLRTEAFGKVASGKVASDKVTSDKVTSDRVTSDKVTSDRVTSDRVTSDRVTSDKVTSDRVTSDKVMTNHPVTLSPLHPLTTSPSHLVTPSPPHNLPGQLTPFFGRATEIAQLSALLLGEDYRLFSLVGEGGIGKTRLALAVAQAILDSAEPSPSDDQNQKSKACPGKIKNQKFPDGVWWVGLAGITTTAPIQEQLAVAVAQASGLIFGGTQPLFTQLLAQLRTKALLLLCDNAEHLLPGLADFLLALLHACPHVTVLVTSRHLLNLQAEFIWRLEGLPLPSPAELQAPAATGLHEYSSIALFLARARRLRRNVAITPEDERAIAAICRLVEGLPLAIELAAMLTKQYSCPELVLALQQDYTVLTTNMRDLAPRHRSIQTMLDYSWHLLTPAEADTLAACSLFVGGFRLDAAAAVTVASSALLYHLVDQSLLQVQAGRFTGHELVRQYAAHQLAQRPEHRHAVCARHAAYYITQLQALATDLRFDAHALKRFQDELGNLRLAWRWSVAQGDLPLLAQGAAGLECGYLLMGLYGEAIQLFEAALVAVRQAVAIAPAHQQGNTLLARLLCHAAHFYRRSGQPESGERLATEACTLADPALQALAYHELARVVHQRGDFITACTLAEQACAQARLTKDPHLLAECLNDVGVVRGAAANPLTAIPYFHEGLHYIQGGVNRLLEGNLVGNLGIYYFAGRQYQAAYAALQQSLTLKQLFPYPESEAISLLQMGDLRLALGLYDQAKQTYDQMLSIVQTVHMPHWESWLHASLTRLHHLQGDLAAAQQACEMGSQLAKSSQQHLQEQWMLINRGHLLTAQGDYPAAHASYEQAIAMPKQVNWAYRTADAHAGLASLLLQTNAIAGAVTHVEAALTFLTQLGLAGANEPFTVYWTAVSVFTAASDPHATAVLRTACQQLQAIAGTLEEAEMRRAFLEKVVVNRSLLAAAQTAGIC